MTIAQQPFNNIFRQPYQVLAYRPDAFQTGVIIHQPPVSTVVNVSVQRLGPDATKALEARGIVKRELKRLFGHVFLPMENEAIISAATGAPEPTDFTFDEDAVTKIAHFYRPEIDGALAGLPPGQRAPTCPAARINIRGVWYEVVNRIEMLNGVLSNFEFHVARLPLDEQLST